MIEEYSEKYIKEILQEVKTVAVVGASANNERDSYKVMESLIQHGYKIFPINPNEQGNLILGQLCYSNLSSVPEKIDMVDVFRSSKYIFDIAKEAVSINAAILWTQEGVVDDKAADFAEKEGLIVIMDECPKKILEKTF